MSIIGEKVMPHLFQQEQPQQRPSIHSAKADDGLSAQRELLTVSLKDIAAQVRVALDNAGLPVEVFFAVPSSGEALLTLATATNPSDPDWARANEIVCEVVGAIIEIRGLWSRCVPCASSGAAVEAADLCLPGTGPVV